MKFKALICDIDGTLIPNKIDGMPSKRVKKAIAMLKSKLHLGTATARSYTQAIKIIDDLQLTDPCILTGGSQIYNPVTKKFYSEKIINESNIEKVRNLAKKMRIELIIADSNGERILTNEYKPVNAYDLYTEALPLKTAEKFMKHLSENTGISLHKTLSWEGDDFVHITAAHPKASKKNAILEVADILNISSDQIIGIGEGYNDIAFLEACGLKIAMGNAVKEVKNIADIIAPSISEDGVAYIIERVILPMF